MDLKKYGQGPYIWCSVIGALLFGIFWLACMIYDPSWDPTKNSISDLSISPSAPLFTAGCIIAAIFLSVYGIGKVIYDEAPGWIAGVAMVLGSIGLASMSLFSKEFYDVHFITAAAAIACFAIAIGLTIIGHFVRKRYKNGILELVICLLACAGFPMSFGSAQSLALICIFLWILAEVYFYKENGCLKNTTVVY